MSKDCKSLFFHRLKKNDKEHILGVRFIEKDNSWQARIKQNDSERTKSFSVKKFGYDYDTVVRSILRQRPCALTNTSFEKQVINCIRNNGRLG